ncbi:MAG: alpha/beta fold hydrolase [Acidobacteriota bacterium]
MKDVKYYLAALGLLICLCPALSAQQSKTAKQAAAQTQFVDLDGHKIRLEVAGSGTPTVVLDYGLGGSIEDWKNIFPEVALFTRVVAYERAGYGKSDAGQEPRSQTQIANELHALLRRANIAPPYVLVGHSMGGANIRAFAHLFKDDVAGLVFVDPLSENIFAALNEREKEQANEQQEAALRNASAGAQGEFRFLKSEVENDFPQLRSYGAPPDVPMMVLVAGRGRPPQWVKFVLNKYGTWVSEAAEGGLVVTPDSRHYIMTDDPALVISAIRRVVFPSVQNALENAIKGQGVVAAIALYRQMKQRYPAEYFRENTLNTLGYQQLNTKHAAEAIALFKLNVEMYPNGFNTYDSLADAYLVQGDRDAAIKNYRKSLQLNPNNTGAVSILKKLESKP